MTQRGKIAALVGAVIVIAAVAIFAVSQVGAGQQSRSSLAVQSVRTYWGDLHKGNTRGAYQLLTSGNQTARPFSQFNQDMLSFLTQTGGVDARVYGPKVKGDQATVHVDLSFVKANRPLKAYQHLYWENGKFRITDPNGGLATRP